MITSFAKNLLVIFALALFYLFIRYPLSHLVLPFYDDGETLYHALSVLHGGVPYRDDFTHHFLGYIIPYLLLAKIIGFSVELTQTLAVINQSLMGWGVFLILKRFVSPGLSLLGALLAISAREPWVLGFFSQYQFNLLIVFIWYFLIRYINEGAKFYLFIGSILTGLLLISDQRVLCLSILPLLAVWMRGENRIGRLLLSGGSIFLPVGLAIKYLWENGALKFFLEQTLFFPIVFRSGSSTPVSFFNNLYLIHKYLWEDTLVIFLLAILGALITLKNVLSYGTRGASFFLLFAGLAQATIPLLGGRDYDYYTIPWLPWLAIMSIIAGDYLIRNFESLRKPTLLLLFVPLLVTFNGWITLIKDQKIQNYRGDGVEKVASKLRKYVSSGEKIFIWGYRLELYVRLNVRSAYMFANNLSIHPDPQIIDLEDRKKHVSPSYEAYFIELLEKAPPDILVFFTLNGQIFPSRADAYLRIAKERQYNFLFEVDGENFRGDKISFEVYRLKSLFK